MKNFKTIVASIALITTFSACTNNKDVDKKEPIDSTHIKDTNKSYINKLGVAVTAPEEADQRDPDIIEGNLPNSDFPN